MMEIDQIAKEAYEIMAAYCRLSGDYSYLIWQEAPQWQKEIFLDNTVFCVENPFSSQKEMHENWRKDRVADDWRLGEMIDPVKKEHPFIVPFDLLPKEQQAKDYLFAVVVRTLVG